jgi:RNA-directed DNA polymerase
MQSKETRVPSVPETAKQGADPDEPSTWSWVEASIWTERMLVVLGDGVKGGKWFSLMDKVYARRTLEAAWKRVAANRGAAGVDGVRVERFKAREGHYLEELEAALKEGRYRPEPVRRVHIPKGPGQTRPLGIPTVKDRIVQTALKMVLEPIFEREFLPVSYGFRPGRGCKDALREVDALLKAGYTFVVDADVKSYLDAAS